MNTLRAKSIATLFVMIQRAYPLVEIEHMQIRAGVRIKARFLIDGDY